MMLYHRNSNTFSIHLSATVTVTVLLLTAIATLISVRIFPHSTLTTSFNVRDLTSSLAFNWRLSGGQYMCRQTESLLYSLTLILQPHSRLQINVRYIIAASSVTVFYCCFQDVPSSWSTSESAGHIEHISSVPSNRKSLQNLTCTNDTRNFKNSTSLGIHIWRLSTVTSNIIKY